LIGLIAVRDTVIPAIAMENKFRTVAARETDVQSLNALQNARGVRAGILEVNRPFDHGIIGVVDRDAFHLQTAGVVGPRENMLHTIAVQRGVDLLAAAGWKERGRRSRAVDKRERRVFLRSK
jgi:hypothetical protein